MILYGQETEKALAVLGKGQTPRPLIRALGEVKLAALRAQQETGQLYPDDYFLLLEEFALSVIAGDQDSQFPLDLSQGGAGTSLHMNMCEVLAKGTNELYRGDFTAHPLDHLARFQSTNDVFSTAVILMTYRFLEEIEKRVIRLQEELVKRENLYEEWLMCGRTELQDALPITLGQVFGAWAGPVERDRWRLNKLKERLRTIPLGGTAIGTGFSAPRNYIFAAEKHLRKISGLPLCRSQNLCDQVAHTDNLAECALGLGLCGDNLYKLVSDLLLYSSSPLSEIDHGEVQYGSTIMPLKSNPVLLEWMRGLTMECNSLSRLIGDYSRSGQWQLNANLPFMAKQFIRLHDSLKHALDCGVGPLWEILKPNREALESHLINSPALLNTLRDTLDYTEIKRLSLQLREDAPPNLEELIYWLSVNSHLTKDFLQSRFTVNKLTGFQKGDYNE